MNKCNHCPGEINILIPSSLSKGSPFKGQPLMTEIAFADNSEVLPQCWGKEFTYIISKRRLNTYKLWKGFCSEWEYISTSCTDFFLSDIYLFKTNNKNLWNMLTVKNKYTTTILMMLIICWHTHKPWIDTKNSFPRTYCHCKEAYRSSHQMRSKETSTQVFSCKFCEMFKNTFLTEHLQGTAC